MNPTSATIQNVTNVSGTVAIASSSTSIGVAKVAASAPPEATYLIDQANSVITSADMIAICSTVVLLTSLVWNVYASKKKQNMDEKFYQLRQAELALERAKFQQETSNAAK
jgi:hypothetical protein